MQDKREKCVQQPKRSKTEAELAAVHQEIEALQTETEQAIQEYEASFDDTLLSRQPIAQLWIQPFFQPNPQCRKISHRELAHYTTVTLCLLAAVHQEVCMCP